MLRKIPIGKKERNWTNGRNNIFERFLLTLFSAILLFNVNSCQPIWLEVDSADNPLIITGWCDEGQPLVGRLGITARGGDIENVSIHTSDLKSKSGNDIIDRKNIRINGETKLRDGIPRNFELYISDIPNPGIYNGSIKLLFEKQKKINYSSIELNVLAMGKSSVSLLSEFDDINMNLVRDEIVNVSIGNVSLPYIGSGINWVIGLLNSLMNFMIGCASKPPSILLPRSAVINEIYLPINNSAPSDAFFIKGEAIAKGEKTGYHLTYPAFNCTTNHKMLAAKNISYIVFSLSRKDIPPDHYVGSLYLLFEDKNSPLVVPIDLNIRAGPILAVILLILGILLGRLYKFYGETGNTKAKNLRKAYHLKGLISNLEFIESNRMMENISELKDDIFQDSSDPIDLKKRLDAIEEATDQLRKLAVIETTALENIKNQWKIWYIIDLIRRARFCYYHVRNDDAKKIVEALNKALDDKFSPELALNLNYAKHLNDAISNWDSGALEDAKGWIPAPREQDKIVLFEMLASIVEDIYSNSGDSNNKNMEKLENIYKRMEKLNEIRKIEKLVPKMELIDKESAQTLIAEARACFYMEKDIDGDKRIDRLNKLIDESNSKPLNNEDSPVQGIIKDVAAATVAESMPAQGVTENVATVIENLPAQGIVKKATGDEASAQVNAMYLESKKMINPMVQKLKILIKKLNDLKKNIGNRFCASCCNFSKNPIGKSLDFATRFIGVATVYIQPIIYVALIIGLTFVGINEIYIGNNTFGATPFSDYLAVFTWGLGSEVISRSLSNLKG